jgi:hypothetical protein
VLLLLDHQKGANGTNRHAAAVARYDIRRHGGSLDGTVTGSPATVNGVWEAKECAASAK